MFLKLVDKFDSLYYDRINCGMDSNVSILTHNCHFRFMIEILL